MSTQEQNTPPSEQEFKDMKAELYVCHYLLSKVLLMDTYENEDGDLFYVGAPANMTASEIHSRAWDLVMNPFDKDDYLDILP